jgi:hypothetical protein
MSVLTTLSRILRSHNSLAYVRACDRVGASLAAYTPIPSLPRSAAFDELRITDAPSATEFRYGAGDFGLPATGGDGRLARGKCHRSSSRSYLPIIP